MATNTETQPYSYSSLIGAIQLATLNDPNTPVVGSQEYLIYSQLIANLAIPTWENERNVLWNELWVDEPAYATIQAQQGDIALPSDFKFIGGGYVRLNYPGGTTTNPIIRPIPVKKLNEIELNPYDNQMEFYVYGNPLNGYYLRPGWIVQTGAAEVGATLSFRYYKYANVPYFDSTGKMLNPNDCPEMSDPNFIIYKVAAQVSAANYNLQLYQIMEDRANYSLKNMVSANEMSSNFMDSYVKDIDGLLNRGKPVNRLQSGFWTNSAGTY